MKNIRKEGFEPLIDLTDTSVQRDKLQCSTRQTLAPDAMEASVCQPVSQFVQNPVRQPLRQCSCCRRLLPLGDFYRKGRLQKPDNCCKECRKAESRLHRKSAELSEAEKPRRHYPVITDIEKRSVRMMLILNALQVVRESVLRKRHRRCEEEGFF